MSDIGAMTMDLVGQFFHFHEDISKCVIDKDQAKAFRVIYLCRIT